MDFDRLIVKACQEIAVADDLGDHDYRPRIKDLNSGHYFLIDTGAALSIFPSSLVREGEREREGGGHTRPDSKLALQAINGTKIPTYGKKTVKLRFDKKTFEYEMVLAPVDSPIIGFDMIMKFKLDLLWTNGQCVLFGGPSKSSYTLQLGRAKRNNLSLAPVKVDMSFQK